MAPPVLAVLLIKLQFKQLKIEEFYVSDKAPPIPPL
jgi:hypothetical protein